MRSLKESILNVDLSATDKHAAKFAPLVNKPDIEPFVEFLETFDRPWEIDNSRTDYGSDCGACVIIHWNSKVDIVMDFLYKSCSEMLYKIEDPKTHKVYYDINATLAMYNFYEVRKWEEFMDWKTKLRKWRTKAMGRVKKAGTYEKPMYQRKVDKYTELYNLMNSK